MTQNKVHKAAAEVTRLWALMCKADNVPVNAHFIVFNPNNPYAKPYNSAVKKLFRLRTKTKAVVPVVLVKR